MRYVLSFIFLTLFFINGCSQLVQRVSMKELYSDSFVREIQNVQFLIGSKSFDKAADKLNKMTTQYEQKGGDEIAHINNLFGTLFFANEEYSKAIEKFNIALQTVQVDQGLKSQLYLNLASGYFVLKKYDQAKESIEQSIPNLLVTEEQQKFYKLKYNLTPKEETFSLVESLLFYYKDEHSIKEIRNDIFFGELVKNYNKLTDREKGLVLEDSNFANSVVTGLLGTMYAENLFYANKKEESKYLIDEMSKRFESHEELSELYKELSFKVDHFSKINLKQIGVILPLTGDKRKYSLRALRGLDSAFRISPRKDVQLLEGKNQSIGNTNRKVKIPELKIRDSKGSGIVGAQAVKELVDDHHVSIIIGGLFPNEAEREYLEARKRGVLFISLSSIYLSKSQKDHLLIEVPGSVESELDYIFSESFLEKFGRRVAFLYPVDERGQTYLSEFWKRMKNRNVELKSIGQYAKNATDYRTPVRKLLGLDFKRERQEELELMKEIYTLEGHQSIRRLQNLTPVVDFDWIYMPSFPDEALSLIPTFYYYDASGFKFVGGNSWRSRNLGRISDKRPLYFVGNELFNEDDSFAQNFISRFGHRPGLIERLAYTSVSLLPEIISHAPKDSSGRIEFAQYLKNHNKIKGPWDEWTLQDNVWVKKMFGFRLYRGEVKEIDYNNL